MARPVRIPRVGTMAPRPNIVFLFADDLGYGDLSCLNAESRISTPHMDRIAREGRICSDAHASSAVCTPSRYSLLTGRNCWRTRLKRGVLDGSSLPLIEPGRPTLAGILGAAGYRTWCVGKWHLGLGWHEVGHDAPAPDALAVDPERINYSRGLWQGPNDHGFDHSCIIPASLDMAPYLYLADHHPVELPTARAEDSPRPAFWRGGPRSPGFAHETCLLEFTTRAESLIDGHARSGSDDPFFLYFPAPSPHTPHVPRPEFRGTTPAGPYGDLVVEHDWSVGRILAALDRNGLTENTLVILSSDNGAHTGPLDLETACGHRSNHIFRGQKSDAWDGGHRVPLLLRWPGRIAAGTESPGLLALNDLVPLCAGVAGASIPAGAAEDAVDPSAILDDPAAVVRETAVHHSIDGAFAVRQGSWKLVGCRGSGGWSLPEDRAEGPALQLYDLATDVSETRNRLAEEPGRARDLVGVLAAAGGPDLSAGLP